MCPHYSTLNNCLNGQLLFCQLLQLSEITNSILCVKVSQVCTKYFHLCYKDTLFTAP